MKQNKDYSQIPFKDVLCSYAISRGVLVIAKNYAIPFAAGFYVGINEGNNIDIEPQTKHTILTAPTAVNAGLSALAASFFKLIGKSSYYELNRDPILEEIMKHDFSELENLADISVTKKTRNAAVKAGVMTGIGYGLGYACAKLT